jgi:phosphatidylinositol-3-phosphatase
MRKRVGKYFLFTSFLLLSLVPVSFAQVPQVNHVFIVLEENTNFSDVIGNPAMPYLNSLANRFGLATNYFANTHPSIGNYFMLTAGQIVTNDDAFSSTVTVDNIVRQLLAQGKTWKAYEEDLPSPGYIAPNVAGYARKHCPLSFYSDVVNSPTEINNLVPFTQFATDLAGNQLPNYSMISPNLCNDAHDCPLSTADTWLRNNIDPLVTSPLFQSDGVLVIVFDESGSDNTNGGGKVAWVVVSPKAKTGFQSTTLYQHQSTLRMTAAALGLTGFPGAAATAPDMAEFFGNPAPPIASDFGLSATPASQSATQGGSASYTLSITPSGGFTGTVSLSASGLPSGATPTFSPSAATTASTMTVTTTAATPTGSFPVTITGTSTSTGGTLTHTASATLVVNAATPPVNPPTPPVNPPTPPVNPPTPPVNPPTPPVNPPTPPVNPPTPPVNPPTPPVNPPTPPVNPPTPPVNPPTPPVNPPTPPVNAPAPAQGDFSLAANPPSQPGSPHTTVKFVVTVASSSGYTGTIELHVQGLPRGAKASFDPASMQNAGSSTLTVSLGASVHTKKYQLTIVGHSQHLRRKTSVVLTTAGQQSDSVATGWEHDND